MRWVVPRLSCSDGRRIRYEEEGGGDEIPDRWLLSGHLPVVGYDSGNCIWIGQQEVST